MRTHVICERRKTWFGCVEEAPGGHDDISLIILF